jgi:hypothetical protein
LSDTFPIQNGIKQGDALTPLLFNFALKCSIRRIQENQVRLNGRHQLPACADGINLFGDNINSIKKNNLIDAGKLVRKLV